MLKHVGQFIIVFTISIIIIIITTRQLPLAVASNVECPIRNLPVPTVAGSLVVNGKSRPGCLTATKMRKQHAQSTPAKLNLCNRCVCGSMPVYGEEEKERVNRRKGWK